MSVCLYVRIYVLYLCEPFDCIVQFASFIIMSSQCLFQAPTNYGYNLCLPTKQYMQTVQTYFSFAKNKNKKYITIV